MRVKFLFAILCITLSAMPGFIDTATAKNTQSGQANQQDMLRRSQELNQRAKSDTQAATDRMRRILQEKRDGQRGLSKDFMNRQGSGNSAGRQ